MNQGDSTVAKNISESTKDKKNKNKLGNTRTLSDALFGGEFSIGETFANPELQANFVISY